MKLLTDFCVSQPIPLLSMTMKINTCSISIFTLLGNSCFTCYTAVSWRCWTSIQIFYPGNSQLVVFFETSLYSCSAHVPIFPCLSAPSKHTKHRFDYTIEELSVLHRWSAVLCSNDAGIIHMVAESLWIQILSILIIEATFLSAKLFTDGSLLKFAFDTTKYKQIVLKKGRTHDNFVGHFLPEKSDIRICVECFCAYPVVFNSSTVIGL